MSFLRGTLHFLAAFRPVDARALLAGFLERTSPSEMGRFLAPNSLLANSAEFPN